MEDKAKEMGVKCNWQYTSEQPTGTCGVIITGENR